MSKKILLVEDTENLKKAIKLKLQTSGFDVIEASDGDMALNILSLQKFDLIITDIIMPSKNGLELLRTIRDRKDGTPVIVLSNVSRMEERNEVNNMGVNTYLVKVETSLETLASKVKQLLE